MEPIKEVVFEREYDASPEEVWRAWTEAEMLKEWWGPDNVIIPECEVDLRAGGEFYIVMEADEGMGQYKGTRWPMLAKFTIVQPKSKISYDAEAWTEGQNKEETMINQTTELTLTPEGQDKTKLKLRAVVHSTGPGAKMAIEGMQYGFTQQLEKLNKFLKKM
jgi:uncharacterized protein YndB with AHSA1/START domain